MKYLKTYEIIDVEEYVANMRFKELNQELLKYSKKISALNTIRNLINLGANVNTSDSSKNTPLIYTTSRLFYSAVKLLIENGADVNASNKNLETPLLILIANHNFSYKKPAYKKILELLIENGADITIKDKHDRDIFYYLDYYKNEDIMNYIKEKFPTEYEEYLMKKNAEKYNL